jgi:hypothetical protein
MSALLLVLLMAQDKPKPDPVLSGRATLLRAAKKPYAAFQGVDAEGRVLLLAEGETEAKAWPLDPDAEVRAHGSWGAVEDLERDARVWAWLRTDRDGKPRSLLLLADEVSEQDIHRVPWTIAALDAEARTIELRRALGKKEETRSLRSALGALPGAVGDAVYVQSVGGELRRAVPPASLAAIRKAQEEKLAGRWRKSGLPGTITSLHPAAGEIEVAIDHEAMRWARALKAGDAVTLPLDKPARALVQEVRPWYEKTRLTLVCPGRELADLAPGRRLRVQAPEPAAELLAKGLPTDAGRPREAAARTEWFLASTYCGCSIAGDGCTGMYYTLAACNTMTCGMPDTVRGFVRPLVAEGKSDAEILEKMEAKFGPAVRQPHLLK